MMQSYNNWRLETDNDQILWLYFDKQNASVNTINREVMEELSSILDHVGNAQYRGIILASAKKTGFIAGADIAQFNSFHDINDAVQLLKRGQHIIDRLENLKIPSVAMIDGFCLGGGLEIALGCHYRVAEDGAKTRIGLPEVNLGIHPGWGGSVRMPRLIGAIQGLELVLTGRTVSAKAAAKLGFVDAAVPRRHLVRAAKYYVLNKPPRHSLTTLQNLTNKQPARALLAIKFRKKLREKINPEHYPAPFLVIDNWERVGVDSHDAAMEREARTCGRLFFSDTSQNLVRVFYLQERLKNQAKDVKFKAQHVHVIGAGTMGGDIAAWCALRGMKVTLQDRAPEFIAPAIKRAAQLYKEKLKEPYLIQKAMDRLIPDVKGDGVKQADVIIEAIFENLKAKQDLFRLLEQTAKPDAILATNTSSIPLDDINSVLESPERLVGIHFFNPVSKMQLVEIVKSDRTKLSIADQAISFVRSIDRLPLPVKSSPGFLVNRILMPYLLEAVDMLDEGIPATTIDKAMTDFGMPMGPIALADTVGLDVCLSVADYLGKYFNTTIPQKLKDLVEVGKLGRKKDAGFYQYKKGKRVKTAEPSTDEKTLTDISDRLVLRMLDEAFACLREGVVADSDLLDAGMILGTGFAPFRGGPIHYAKSKGIGELFQQFVSQQEKRGSKTESIQNWEEQGVV